MMTIGTLVAGRYEIRDRLGQGSQGHVLEAFDRQLGRLVALKVLPISGGSAEERAERRRRFLTEARAAARLQHPGIVAVHDAGEAENEAWIAMELVIGQTLRDALREPARLPLREALRIGRELLDALDAAHARGVIHRDVKPYNIMLAMDAGDGHGRVRLTDFGIASLVAGQKPGDFEFVGTPSVMAPEQIRGEACDERTDLWSAGVVLYELLTGTPPFAGGVPAVYSAVLARDPLPPTLLNPDLPLAFDTVMETALAKSISRRFQSAREMAAAIDDVAGALLDPRQPETMLPPAGAVPPPPASRSARTSTALAFLAGAVAASAGFVWRDNDWRGWPGHAVIAAALPPEPASVELLRIAKDDVAASPLPGRPQATDLLAATSVEPLPADAGLAGVDTAAGPVVPPLPEQPPIVLAEGAAATAPLPDPLPAEVPRPSAAAEASLEAPAIRAEAVPTATSAIVAAEPERDAAPPQVLPAEPVTSLAEATDSENAPLVGDEPRGPSPANTAEAPPEPAQPAAEPLMAASPRRRPSPPSRRQLHPPPCRQSPIVSEGRRNSPRETTQASAASCSAGRSRYATARRSCRTGFASNLPSHSASRSARPPPCRATSARLPARRA
ncbi:serine/threonine-protein kinase [Neoroseomonas lacus]|uniref:Protein kinase domain-containing protein n=1 Tax=Neoroseomonas lacus TaxID=287609 RepID=A0A917NGN3_9PROT|nr:serine/threonine-protein kinase [Neoroseomonas lacus]GGI99149.1 hypothetical protein GCM10011320_02340 [Neoroseomonas lacus]